MKRCFDLIVAFLLLLLLSPVMFGLWACVRIRFGSPTIFAQWRPGLGGKPFLLYKFRTMTNETDQQGRLLPDERRITPFGGWLRKYSLDELPQLWNVVKGELSLVGPRPLLMEYLPLYNREQARRHEVRPGITGWAQVHGRNALTWEEKFALDVWYVDHRSFWLDLRILWMTLCKVVHPAATSAQEFFIVEDFTGSARKAMDE
ncbi:sugar transferase [Brevibacillus fulvus]|uniref:Sugar transferase EpsL n=1 Tax=Brevibacillus fulvus TaxID=1125967 RepID=A0A938XWC1_9BACL|nr:sugar transferase [Brevibacillus fulvus]MBM7588905.1 sugar transferase EpsL [Brevibacillus fulvus]